MPYTIINGKRITIAPSTRENKQLMATFPNGRVVHFGDPSMKEYPGTSRGDNYCARSSGIKGVDDPYSPNYWSRKYLWHCVGKKSVKK